MGFKKTVGMMVLGLPFVASLHAGSLHETVAAQPGFTHFYNLEYDQALAVFTAETARIPTSPDAYNHIAQTILYREMYRAGMLSSDFFVGTKFVHQPKLVLSDADDQQLHDALNRAIGLCEERLAAKPDDTAALYAKGVSFG